jgi:S-DNA-T family DNA segregation ATPase FtsK/SpoIIIE
MAARKKSTKTRTRTPRKPLLDELSPHTRHAIAAVGFLVLGVFFVLALLESAGLVGELTKTALVWLFGTGAYAAPLVCGFYIYALMRPQENEEVSRAKIFGIGLGFSSLLGGLELYHLASGGAIAGGGVGWVLATPLMYLFNELAAAVILSAIFVVSIFLVFDIGLRKPKPKEEPVEEDTSLEHMLNSGDLEDETVSEPEPEPAAEKPKRSLTARLGTKAAEPKEFAVSNFEGKYDPPPLSLLSKNKGKPKSGNAKESANIIKQTLDTFGIRVEMDEVEIGPTVTRYALKPAQGVKIARIVGLQRELEMNLASGTIRIEAPIPGKSLVGIEVPNIEKATVGLASLLASPEYTDSPNPLLTALGKDITGHAHFANIARMPHALIAGTTGSGKSVMIHNLVVSLLYRNSPEQLRFIMVDPKRVELTLYNGIPHLMTEVITDAKKALLSLKWAVKEMERRYDILQAERVQNIASYHKNVYRKAKKKWVEAGEPEEEKQHLPEPLPYIVVMMDELADLMHAYPRELEASIVRLAQMSRAVGIHLILATQRPSVNVITGTIKANIPTRMAFQVASQIDSRTIIDQVGAEKLLGKGDMLFLSGELGKPMRLQSSFLSEDEVKNVVDYLKNQADAHTLESIDLEEGNGNDSGSFFGSLSDDEEEDELYEEAKQAVIEAGKASTSYLQRKLKVGYSRGARLIDMLEERGVIGPQEGSKPRAILMTAADMAADDAEDEADEDVPQHHSY